MNIFFNHEEGRIRAGWRLAGQFFVFLLTGLTLTALLSSLFNSTNSLIYGFSMTVAAWLSTYAAGKGLDKRLWRDFGIILSGGWLKQWSMGFLLAGLVIAIIFIIEYAAGWLTITGYGWQGTTHTLYIWAFLGYLLFMVLVGFYEELVFRGYQIVNLAEGLNSTFISREQAVVAAVVLSSVFFGLLHLRNPNASWLSTLNIAIAGVMLAFPFLVTGRLSYSIGLHTGWNFFQGGIFGFAVSGTVNHASLIQIHTNGPLWVTGGVFGPEAGLLGLFGMMLAVAGFIGIFNYNKQSIAVDERFGIYEPYYGATNKKA